MKTKASHMVQVFTQLFQLRIRLNIIYIIK